MKLCDRVFINYRGNRAALWAEALDITQRHPVVGTGSVGDKARYNHKSKIYGVSSHV